MESHKSKRPNTSTSHAREQSVQRTSESTEIPSLVSSCPESALPNTVRHGEAWRYFSIEMRGKLYGEDETRQAWDFFLAGWLAKAKQQDKLRGKR